MVSRGILRKASASKTFQVGSAMFSIGGRGRLMKILKLFIKRIICTHLKYWRGRQFIGFRTGNERPVESGMYAGRGGRA